MLGKKAQPLIIVVRKTGGVQFMTGPENESYVEIGRKPGTNKPIQVDISKRKYFIHGSGWPVHFIVEGKTKSIDLLEKHPPEHMEVEFSNLLSECWDIATEKERISTLHGGALDMKMAILIIAVAVVILAVGYFAYLSYTNTSLIIKTLSTLKASAAHVADANIITVSPS